MTLKNSVTKVIVEGVRGHTSGIGLYLDFLDTSAHLIRRLKEASP